MAQRRGVRPLPEAQKVTKQNINQLILADKRRLQVNTNRNRQLIISDTVHSDRMVLKYMQSGRIQQDTQDIRIGRLQRVGVRELKGQLQEVLLQCLRTRRIDDVQHFLTRGSQVNTYINQTLGTFLRELGYHRNGYRVILLENIPFFKYGHNDLQEPEMCSICFTEYQEGVECIRLQCNHIFHRPCISQWLRLKKNCPLCKRQVKFNLPANPN